MAAKLQRQRHGGCWQTHCALRQDRFRLQQVLFIQILSVCGLPDPILLSLKMRVGRQPAFVV